MRKPFAIVATLTLSGAAAAHDFWLQPRAFHAKTGEPVPITLQIGHGAQRKRWQGGEDRMVQLVSFGPDGRTDLRPGFRALGAAVDLAPEFTRPGLYVVAMQTDHAVSNLPAGRFDDYVREEGIAPIQLRRGRANRAPGREIYSRRAKTLLQVGARSDRPDSRATRAVGLRLEIVPERDPYALGPDLRLPLHVQYRGRRLPGALVKLIDLNNDARPRATAITDRAGRAVFSVPASGHWLLHVVWSEPVSGDPRAEYDTTFSSLTFGYDPPG